MSNAGAERTFSLEGWLSNDRRSAVSRGRGEGIQAPGDYVAAASESA